MRYKVGLYGGSFNPLHMGHIDCILQAANQCETLYIVLSIGKNRNEIDCRIRYRWIYQLTSHIGNVKIIMIEDNADTKASYTKELWLADAEKVKKQIGEKIDVVFAGSDYDERSFWNACYPESQFVVFPRNEINSTEIRKNPFRHWDWIPRLVRPYYTKKVLLTGGESVGKSTLTVNLKNRFNAAYIAEAARDISEKSGTDLMMLSEDFSEILLQHKLNEMKAMEQGEQLLFIDTDTLVTQFYMHFLEDKNIQKNKALSDAIDSLNDYDLILFLEPDVPFVQDGDRSLVIASDRIKYSEQIKNLLKSHGKAFVSVCGNYQERYTQAVKAVERLLKQ